MKLIKLEINNFRQFHGKQTIEFSVDSDKNVTLIHGENNGGKTALLNALRWSLYEETSDNLQDPQNLINRHALENGINTYCVYVQLIHNNRLLEVRRTGYHSSRSSTLKVFEIIDGCYAQHSDQLPNTLINTFLPKEMSHYFFYQGEGTGTLSSQNNFSHIKDAISKVLGLTVGEKTLTHLNKIKTDYQKDLKQYDTNNQISSLLFNKEKIEQKCLCNRSSLDRKKLMLEEAEKEYEAQISEFARFDKTAIDKKIKLRSQKETELARLKKEHSRLLSNKEKNLPQWMSNAYGKKLGSFDLSVINIEELNISQRYTIDKQLIKVILANQECICGSAVIKNSEVAQLISELEKSAVDSDLKRRWLRAVDLHSQLANYSSPKQAMASILSDIDDCDEMLNELESCIRELSFTIEESKIDDIKAIEHKKNAAKGQCDQLRRDIPKLEFEINKAKEELKDIDSRVMRLSSTQPKAAKIRELIKAVEKIAELYESAICSSKEGVELILLKKMQVLFSRVAFNGYTVKKNSSSDKKDSFTWAIVDKEDKKVAAGNGYQAMLAISFIIALIQFSKERANNKQHLLTPGTIAPFIADSILAFIGPDNGRELVRYIANSVEQSIFMFSQAQWTESHTDKGIRDKIGKEYTLVQHTVLTEYEFKGEYPTQLTVQGHKFDVVRFGSEFEKVTIEEILLND